MLSSVQTAMYMNPFDRVQDQMVSLLVCMCVCVCVCAHTHMHACMHVLVYIDVFLSAFSTLLPTTTKKSHFSSSFLLVFVLVFVSFFASNFPYYHAVISRFSGTHLSVDLHLHCRCLELVLQPLVWTSCWIWKSAEHKIRHKSLS